MRYLFVFIALSLALASCEKEQDESITALTKLEYGSFITKTGTGFSGSLDKKPFSWNFGMDFQSIAGFQNGNGVCDSTDPARIVFFGLTSNDVGHTTQYNIYSPKYNSSSPAEFAQVFSTGKKKLGDLGSAFHLTISHDKKFYRSRGADPANTIEILKTEEIVDNTRTSIRVWFKIDANLSACLCEGTTAALSKGLMVADFIGCRFGK